jgi:hypothetical protein
MIDLWCYRDYRPPVLTPPPLLLDVSEVGATSSSVQDVTAKVVASTKSAE